MTTSAAPPQWECSQARIALGVYVLGAIDPAEQALVEEHLDSCDACLAEMAVLADLPAVLALVPTEEAIAALEAGQAGEAPEPPEAGKVVGIAQARAPQRAPASEDKRGSREPEAHASVHDLSAARRRRRQLARTVGVAAAAVVIGAASYGGVRLAAGQAAAPSASAGQDPHYVVGAPNGPWLTGYGSTGAVTATVAYRPLGWGTQLAAKIAGLPLDTPCQLWVVEGNGTRVQAGSWATDANEGSVWYPGSAEVAATAIKSFVITIADRQPVTIAAS